MDFILNQIEQKIKDHPENGDKSIAINLHQIWFLYLIILHLAIFYNTHREKVSEEKEGFLSCLKNPAFGTLLTLCRRLQGTYSYSGSDDQLKNILEHEFGEFVKIRNKKIGHSFPISSEKLADTLTELKKSKTLISDAVTNCLDNGVESFIGNSCDIICVTKEEDGWFTGKCYTPGKSNADRWTSDLKAPFACGETYLSLKLNDERKVIRISPFIHIDTETDDIYIFHTITKEILGQVLYYRISDDDLENFTLSWSELTLPHRIGKREAYQDVHESTFFQEIIVDPYGRGDVMSIEEALAIAGDQTKIIVKPGSYHEKLVIDKPVFICGEEGPAGAPVIWGNVEGPCVQIHAPAHLKTLRLSNDQAKKGNTGIVIDGNAKIEDVEIFNWSGTCIRINAGSNPQIVDCEIKDSTVAAYMEEGSSGSFEKCAIRNCEIAMKGKKATIKLNKCEFEKNLFNLDYTESNVSATDCKFHDCDDGLRGTNVDLTLEGCIFQRISCTVISLSDSEGCSIENCEFSKSGLTGIELDNSPDFRIDNCKFHNIDAGIRLSESTGSIWDCEFFENSFHAILAEESKEIEISNCKFYGEKESSYAISFNNSIGKISRCNISNFSEIAISILNVSKAIIDSCKLHDCKGSCLKIRTNSEAVVNQCEFFQNTTEEAVDVWAEDKSFATVKECHFHKSKSICCSGSDESCILASLCLFDNSSRKLVYLFGKGQGYFEQCEFESRECSTYTAEGKSSLFMVNCRFLQASTSPPSWFCSVMLGGKRWDFENIVGTWSELKKFIAPGWHLPSSGDLNEFKKFLGKTPIRITSECVPLSKIFDPEYSFWISDGFGILRAQTAHLDESREDFSIESCPKNKKQYIVGIKRY